MAARAAPRMANPFGRCKTTMRTRRNHDAARSGDGRTRGLGRGRLVRLTRLMLVALVAGVAGARGQTPPEPATGPALSGLELRARIAGNTLHRQGTTLGIGWDWAAYYRPDGRMVARAWWAFGDIEGRGTWRIDDGRWCQFWETVDWSEGGENCYRIYPAGARLYWEHRYGPHTDDWTFAVREGNPFGLGMGDARKDGPPRPDARPRR